jgi:hypothetical protein
MKWKITKHLCQSSLVVIIDKYKDMKNLDLIAEELFNKVRGRFPSVTIGNENGEVTNMPQQARFFDFDYKEGGKSLGKISISLDEKAVSVMYSQDIVEDEDSFTKEKWFNFLKEIRVFAKKRMLNFDTRNITKSNLNKRDYKFLAQQGGEQTMSESKMYGTSKISYQDIGNARLSIKHTESINQELASGRTQKIGAIYVENADGERFKYPFKHLNGARAMARHVAEGGKPYDDFGKHITGLSEELSKLRKFKTYMGRSAVMAESLSEYMDVVKERIATVKKTVESLQKESYYKEAFETFEVPVMEDVPEDVAENWIDQLTIRQFNEELQDVFPYIYKLVSEASKAKELGPEQLEEFDIMNPIDSVKKWHKGRMDKYEAELKAVRQMAQKIDKNGALDAEATCNADPVDCLKKFIADNGGNIKDSYNPESEFESMLDNAMGQFAEEDTDEADDTIDVKMTPDGGIEKADAKEQKLPLSEFILSYFDKETGQFPKGETAILTAIEKDYGEEFINPAKQFIEKINNKMAEMYGYKDPELMDNQAPSEQNDIMRLAGL